MPLFEPPSPFPAPRLQCRDGKSAGMEPGSVRRGDLRRRRDVGAIDAPPSQPNHQRRAATVGCRATTAEEAARCKGTGPGGLSALQEGGLQRHIDICTHIWYKVWIRKTSVAPE